jgi:hypothetical protein
MRRWWRRCPSHLRPDFAELCAHIAGKKAHRHQDEFCSFRAKAGWDISGIKAQQVAHHVLIILDQSQ